LLALLFCCVDTNNSSLIDKSPPTQEQQRGGRRFRAHRVRRLLNSMRVLQRAPNPGPTPPDTPPLGTFGRGGVARTAGTLDVPADVRARPGKPRNRPPRSSVSRGATYTYPGMDLATQDATTTGRLGMQGPAPATAGTSAMLASAEGACGIAARSATLRDEPPWRVERLEPDAPPRKVRRAQRGVQLLTASSHEETNTPRCTTGRSARPRRTGEA